MTTASTLFPSMTAGLGARCAGCSITSCDCNRRAAAIREDASRQYQQLLRDLNAMPDPELTRPQVPGCVKAGSRRTPGKTAA